MAQQGLTAFFSDTPSGAGMEYWGQGLPSGWLWQDGSFYDPDQYPELFEAIGYGIGRLGDKFKVPDRRGRVAIGAGDANGLTGRQLGQVGGSERVVLTPAQMPRHNHSAEEVPHTHSTNELPHNHGIIDPKHKHTVIDPKHRHGLPPSATSTSVGTSNENGRGNENVDLYTSSESTGISLADSATNIQVANNITNITLNPSTAGILIGDKGDSEAHENMQPFIVCPFIIKI